jgi:hypothetical protein
MSIQIRNVDGETVEAVATGKLTQMDYRALVPEIEKRLKNQQRVRMLMEIHDFHGWSVGGVWEEYKFDVVHGTAVDRLAMVGPRMVSETHSAFDHPFVVNEVKYFDGEHVEDARAWLRSEIRGDA